MADRTLTVKIIGDSRSLQREFQRSSAAAATFQGKISGVSVGVGKLLAAGGAALGIREVFQGFRGATDAASDLSEQINKSNVVFGRSAGEIKAWSQTTDTAFGISQRAALEAAGAFGQLFETAGLNEQLAAQFSQRLVELSADIASFNDIDPSEALDKLRSGLAGEAEPLRRVGVLLSEARVKQEAYASGIARAGAKLTEGQKVQARYNLILKDTARQQGDFGRTSTGLANQQRILAAQLEKLQAKIGQALLPSVLALTTGLTKWLSNTKNQQRVQRDFQSVVQAVGDTLKVVRDIVVTLAPVFRGATQAVGGLSNALKLLVAAFALAKLRGFTSGLGLAAAATKDLSRELAIMETAATLRFGRIGAAAARLASSLALLRTPITIVVALEFLRGGRDLKTIRDGVKELVNDLKSGNIAKAFGGDASGNLRTFAAAFAEVQRTVDRLPKSSQAAARRIVQAFQIDPTKTLKQNINELNIALLSIQTPAGRASASIEGVRSSIEAAIARTQNFGAKLTQTIASTKGLTASQRNQFFDAALGRQLDRVQDRDLQGQLAALDKIAASIEAQIAKVKDVTRKLKLRDDLLGVQRQQKAVRQQLADDFLEGLDLGVTAAELTRSLADDLQAVNAVLAAVNQQIRVQGRTNALESRRLALLQQQASILERQRQAAQDAAEKRRAANKARQFRQLGLTGTGDDRVAGVGALTRRLGTLRQQVKGTFLDTSKTRSQFAQIAKVLAEGPKKVGRDVRAAIQQMFSDINDALNKGSERKGPLTKFRVVSADEILSGFGLSPEQLRLARARLAKLGAGGTMTTGGVGAFGRPVAGATAGIVVSGPITVVANDPNELMRKLQRTARKRATQTTGPTAGNSTGIVR